MNCLRSVAGWSQPDSAAALIVGVVVIVIGYVLISRARSALQPSSLMPRRTIESLKEDKEWVQEQIS